MPGESEKCPQFNLAGARIEHAAVTVREMGSST
jgi:hypothetical protein